MRVALVSRSYLYVGFSFQHMKSFASVLAGRWQWHGAFGVSLAASGGWDERSANHGETLLHIST